MIRALACRRLPTWPWTIWLKAEVFPWPAGATVQVWCCGASRLSPSPWTGLHHGVGGHPPHHRPARPSLPGRSAGQRVRGLPDPLTNGDRPGSRRVPGRTRGRRCGAVTHPYLRAEPIPGGLAKLRRRGRPGPRHSSWGQARARSSPSARVPDSVIRPTSQKGSRRGAHADRALDDGAVPIRDDRVTGLRRPTYYLPESRYARRVICTTGPAARRSYPRPYGNATATGQPAPHDARTRPGPAPRARAIWRPATRYCSPSSARSARRLARI